MAKANVKFHDFRISRPYPADSLASGLLIGFLHVIWVQIRAMYRSVPQLGFFGYFSLPAIDSWNSGLFALISAIDT